MQTYTEWLAEIVEYLVNQLAHTELYTTRVNLRGLYDAGYSTNAGIQAVIEVAARHGNADAKEILRERKRRGI